MDTGLVVLIGAMMTNLLAGAWLYGITWRWWRSLLMRRRFQKGRSGEERARTFLLRHGYRILAEQADLRPAMWIDGEKQEYPIRADFLVQKRGRRAVVEAKTGLATSACSRDTRRQLLEYALCYDVDQVLLFDGNTGSLKEVSFALKGPMRARSPGLTCWLAGFICGAATAGLLLHVFQALVK